MLRDAIIESIKLVYPDHIDRVLKQSTLAAVAKLFFICIDDSLIEERVGCEDEPFELQEQLQHYKDIFSKPKSLTLLKAHDHQIPLKPGTIPHNVKPYQYLYIRKIY